VACTIPETRTYTIYIPDERGSVSENTDTAVTININSEHYLKQSYIAYRNSSYQIEISKYSKWESSPGKIIKNQFKNTLSRTGVFREVRTDSVAPTGSYSLKINLKQFERFDEGADSFGMLAFDADFLSPNGQNLYRSTIYKKIKLDSRNFSSLAKGLSTALKEGIDEINTNIISAVNKQITAP
jgi:uncharacterized lipoprotein YmbA